METRDDAYNRQTVAVMERCLGKGSNCVDVGCHTGMFLREIIRIAPEGRHFAFEPLPECYRYLVENFGSFPHLRIYDVALGNTAGPVPFKFVVSNPGYSGFRRRRYDRADEKVEEITVRADLLDNILPPALPIHFIKIDVEGAELQVIQGAAGTIRSWKPVVVFEFGLGAADWYGTTPDMMFDLLAGEFGMQVSLMEGWLAGGEPLSRAAFNEQFSRGMNYYFMAHP
ncbi:MAG: FkbM family methyltransferase [bacterium]|nr:FkbM family methyltransferase [bacterium]